MKLSKILTPYCYQLLQYWKSVDNGIISREKSKRIFVLLAANYGNIGDIAITIAQKKLLTDLCKDFEIVLMPSTSSFSDLKSLVKNIGKNDILTFVGGGNCGDLYYSYEIYRQLVVELLPKNKIVVFPQSIKFTEKKNFLRAKKHYGKAKENLTFCARELDSFKLAKDLCYLNSVVLLPDVVFTMSYFHDLSNREGIMTCLRTDKERYLTDYDHSMIFSSSLCLSSLKGKIIVVPAFILASASLQASQSVTITPSKPSSLRNTLIRSAFSDMRTPFTRLYDVMTI